MTQLVQPIYNSRDIRCKDPFGAAKTGETVTFTIHLPKLRHDDAPVLKLYNLHRSDEPIVFPMHQMAEGDFLHNRYRCTVTPDEPGIFVYYFEIYSEGHLLPLRMGEGGFGVLGDEGRMWQMTVYDRAMEAPAFLREGVLYQIFPDRFFCSGQEKQGVPEDRTLRQDWGGIPHWRPNERGVVTNSDYFGGDLPGIREKLPYLQSLGVTAIYLNPIFEAHSNHRYNTADYNRTDPLLGTEEDFRELCAAAKRRGISIILDGVFSHTGSDSIYFNREGRYGEGGAFRDPDSPYFPWYRFSEHPWQYDCWWGFETLPNVEETEESYLSFVCGKDGVLWKWLELGASGYRLDVADELPDVFLDRLRESVKSYDKNAAIIGEVWEDASNKESYGVRRRYLLGGQLDSVMNYPFREAVLGYIRWGSHQYLYDTILQVLENYPKPAIQALMNFLSTHDTERAITALGGALVERHDREWQEQNHYLDEGAYEHGCRLFRLACILQFGLPGIPCIYYGDEAGLAGYKDPFNRTCYPWGNENQELLALVRGLGQVRKQYPIFGEAAFVPLIFSRDVCAFLRRGKRHSIVFAVNRTQMEQRLMLPRGFEKAEVLVRSGDYDGNMLGSFSGVVLLGRTGRITNMGD